MQASKSRNCCSQDTALEAPEAGSSSSASQPLPNCRSVDHLSTLGSKAPKAGVSLRNRASACRIDVFPLLFAPTRIVVAASIARRPRFYAVGILVRMSASFYAGHLALAPINGRFLSSAGILIKLPAALCVTAPACFGSWRVSG